MNANHFNILLVEDQVRHQKIYGAAIVEHLGAQVRFAASGAEAMQAINSTTPPDLVILDLEIPGIRGEELLAKIRADHRLNQIPVIILTGHAREDKQMELLDLGADDFIEKGGSPAVLIARLRAQMRHKIAVDRLERLALDRDLFAAGVLHDIGTSHSTIKALCEQGKQALMQDGDEAKNHVLAICDKLKAHAAKLGAYATDVIQSVRDSQQPPKLEQQDIGELLSWVADVCGESFRWSSPEGLRPVLADKSLLRLALMNIVQSAQQHMRGGAALQLEVTQVVTAGAGDVGRSLLTTRLKDNAASLSSAEVARLFMPQLRAFTPQDEDDEHLHTSDSRQSFSVGLALVAKVMLRMGGRVWGERAPDGSGTVINFELQAP